VGQTRRFDLLSITSDLPSTSDVSGPGRHFAFGPLSAARTRSKSSKPFRRRTEVKSVTDLPVGA
jgi:hypothetical protein